MPEPLISVLLPTRNGVELLGDCVRGVLSQEGEDFELIVADNANDDGTAELLRSFSADRRLTVVRQEQPASVVENWNLALGAATGRYILVIGDDDLLLPWYMERARALLERFEMPDCLSYNGYRYAFPGFARSGETGSHYADPFFTPHPWIPREGILGSALRRRVLSDFARFVMPLTLNMQVTLVSRQVLGKLVHPEFRAPFPDFYALLALLASAESWAISDEQLIAVGVSANSFSQSLSDETDAKRGMSYLGVKTDFPGALPGNDLFNGIHVCLEQVRSDYSEQIPDFEIDRAQYLLSQLLWWYAQLRLGALPPRGLVARLRRLRLSDWWLIARTLPSRLSRLGVWLRLDKSDPNAKDVPQHALASGGGQHRGVRSVAVGAASHSGAGVSERIGARPRLTVVIPNYNGRELLEVMLSSLGAQTFRSFSTVVVDDCSTDDSVSYLHEQWPAIEVIALPRNGGVTAAMNVALHAAEGELIGLFNNDTELAPQCLAELVSALERHPEAGSATPKMLDFLDRSVLDGAGDQLSWRGGGKRRGHGQRDVGQFDEPGEVFAACGGAALYRREALESVGELDEAYFAYYEDLDWGFRAQLAGFRCRYVPSAVLYHHGSATLGRGMTEFNSYQLWRNPIWLIVKCFPAGSLVRHAPDLLRGQLGNLYVAVRLGKLRVWGRAMRDALLGLPVALRKRRAIQRTRVIDASELERLAGTGPR